MPSEARKFSPKILIVLGQEYWWYVGCAWDGNSVDNEWNYFCSLCSLLKTRKKKTRLLTLRKLKKVAPRWFTLCYLPLQPVTLMITGVVVWNRAPLNVNNSQGRNAFEGRRVSKSSSQLIEIGLSMGKLMKILVETVEIVTVVLYSLYYYLKYCVQTNEIFSLNGWNYYSLYYYLKYCATWIPVRPATP